MILIKVVNYIKWKTSPVNYLLNFNKWINKLLTSDLGRHNSLSFASPLARQMAWDPSEGFVQHSLPLGIFLIMFWIFESMVQSYQGYFFCWDRNVLKINRSQVLGTIPYRFILTYLNLNHNIMLSFKPFNKPLMFLASWQ